MQPLIKKKGEPLLYSESHEFGLLEKMLFAKFVKPHWFALKMSSFLAVQMTQQISMIASMENWERNWVLNALKFSIIPPWDRFQIKHAPTVLSKGTVKKKVFSGLFSTCDAYLTIVIVKLHLFSSEYVSHA